ncbi:hypothetical protein Prum_028430 [Phytohabitans rumicis]|uniref:Uncharacterized protein n=1 Tax=Phytohabitans rumicis TaxID=1076125 RepID=A0A6V8L341_9ACTN|nr:hypothetical protein Prum_028430 [Phytohabitans rumicis]
MAAAITAVFPPESRFFSGAGDGDAGTDTIGGSGGVGGTAAPAGIAKSTVEAGGAVGAEPTRRG